MRLVPENFLMEAMWTRFLPVMVRLRQMIKEGVIGEARMVQADFGFRKEIDLKSRFFDLNWGRRTADVGIYPLTLSAMLFGPPTDMASLANLLESAEWTRRTPSSSGTYPVRFLC